MRILAGMYSDSETGLYYWYSRYYDPKTGRGISPDRMSVAEHVQRWQANMGSTTRLPLEINPYAYVANNPLRWIDPKGEAAEGAAIGGTIGGVLGGLIGGLGGGAACTVVAPGVGTIACGGGGAMQGALEGATIGAIIGSKIEDMCKDDDDDRCKKVKERCIQGCSDFVLQKPGGKRGDLGGMDFHRCVRQCMDRNGC
jgi:RHS repeat-associated protein